MTDCQFGLGTFLVPAHGSDLSTHDDEQTPKHANLRLLRPLSCNFSKSSFVFEGVVATEPPQSRESVSRHATEPNKPGLRNVVVKMNWIRVARASEESLIRKARQIAEHSNRKWAGDRLPQILSTQATNEYTEHEIRSHFALADPGPECGVRSLSIIVFASLLRITTITSPLELLQVYIDLIGAYKFLVRNCGILHQDISLDNLMYYINVENGIAYKCGVINDFDSAVLLTDRSIPSLPRAGKPFIISCDLLNPAYNAMPHYPRHDLESFFYSMLRHVTSYDVDTLTNQVIRVQNPKYGKWETKSPSELLRLRESFWSSLEERLDRPSHFDLVFEMTIWRLYMLIKEGKDAFHSYMYSCMWVSSKYP